MYVPFPLSSRNAGDLPFKRGIDICHEAVHHWRNRFGPMFAADIRRQRVSRMRGFCLWRWHLDEMSGEAQRSISGGRSITRASSSRATLPKPVKRRPLLPFMKKVPKRHGSPQGITTDGLRSGKQQVRLWANDRVENSHLSLRRRGMGDALVQANEVTSEVRQDPR